MRAPSLAPRSRIAELAPCAAMLRLPWRRRAGPRAQPLARARHAAAGLALAQARLVDARLRRTQKNPRAVDREVAPPPPERGVYRAAKNPFRVSRGSSAHAVSFAFGAVA